LRFSWTDHKEELLQTINRGDYLFSPVKKITKANGNTIHLWCSQDALVMKLLAEVLTELLNLSKLCTHVKGHGGLKHSVVQVQSQLAHYQYVCKTDVKSFYESIDQYLLMEQIHDHINNKLIKRYLWQVIRRTVEYGGLYNEIIQGISSGCTLSSILGALYLKTLDEQFDKEGLFYLRYMDDIVILMKTRWQNRRAITLMNQCFNQLKVKQHPDKTFIGKIEKGFDFLGYHFSREPLQVAHITVKKHVERLYRLYEQQKKKKATSVEMAFVLGNYVKRWQCWCNAGLGFVIANPLNNQADDDVTVDLLHLPKV
jgi:RNA-directed DNA polymerase